MKHQHDLTPPQKAHYLLQEHTHSSHREPPLPLFNSQDDLSKAYLDCFNGTSWFSLTYHITLGYDAKSVIFAPRRCPIAMQPLVHDKLDEFINQGIIVPVIEPTDLVSSLVYSWKANGQLHIFLDPRDLSHQMEPL